MQTKILQQFDIVVYLIIYMVLYNPGGCLAFLPSTVAPGRRPGPKVYMV